VEIHPDPKPALALPEPAVSILHRRLQPVGVQLRHGRPRESPNPTDNQGEVETVELPHGSWWWHPMGGAAGWVCGHAWPAQWFLSILTQTANPRVCRRQLHGASGQLYPALSAPPAPVYVALCVVLDGARTAPSHEPGVQGARTTTREERGRTNFDHRAGLLALLATLLGAASVGGHDSDTRQTILHLVVRILLRPIASLLLRRHGHRRGCLTLSGPGWLRALLTYAQHQASPLDTWAPGFGSASAPYLRSETAERRPVCSAVRVVVLRRVSPQLCGREERRGGMYCAGSLGSVRSGTAPYHDAG
jgi:hypothetical protein